MNKLYYFIRSEYLGQGNDELGQLLMRNFLHTIANRDEAPSGIIFINSGVKLPSILSDVAESLSVLEGKGVEILSCGTCLDYYGLKDKLAFGKISNIHDITDRLADNQVVTI